MCRNLLAGSVLCIAGFTTFSCNDTYDLDSKQPNGSRTESIYGFMEKKGNFKNFLRLIDDLGFTEILSKTGSKTLFPADDDAFNEFYKSNDWGVSGYDDLSLAQKKLLMNSAIIDNPISISMLSTAEGPVRGEVCRRMSSQSIYDSVQVISTSSEELPQTDKWFVLRNHPEIVLFKDASGANPMVHFTQKFLDANEVLSTDVDFLYNDPAGSRQPGDAHVNRAKILESMDCKNGFVHIVDRVITPLDNMAEIIRKNNDMNIFSGIVERFAAPYHDATLTDSYNQNKGTAYDSVFVKRYFSKRSEGSSATSSTPFNKDKEGNDIVNTEQLKFDPGWNTFVTDIFNNRTPLMEDMGVMLVPTDAAMKEWWNNGSGKVIKDQYGSIENTPNSVLAELVNVNMLSSLVASVPSRFPTILNDANEPMGVTADAINKVHLGCNGAVYETNKVFAPASYSSVLFPAVIDTEHLNVIMDAIEFNDYKPYLNSMVSNYSFFIPTNDGLLTYIDPVSYGKKTTLLWEFYYDKTETYTENRNNVIKSLSVCANVYEAVEEGADENGNGGNGHWVKSGDVISTFKPKNQSQREQIVNRLEDILDNIIGVEGAYEGKEYIITKGKNFIRLGGRFGVAGEMTASGSWQNENNQPCVVKEIYNMENGRAYIIDAVLTGTRKATSDILFEHPELSEFYEMMTRCDALGTSTTDGYSSASQDKPGVDEITGEAIVNTFGNLITSTSGTSPKTYSLFNAFHYTVYAPTNDAMKMAYEAGLPTLEELTAAEQYDSEHEDENAHTADEIMSVMRDFVRYHIQNNSIYLDNGFQALPYESLKNKMEPVFDENGNQMTTEKDGVTYIKCISGSPYRITVNSVSPTELTLSDAMHNTRHVITSGGTYNLQGREYWLDNKDIEKATLIKNSSSVVVHAIDGPLFFDKDQFIYVPREIVADEFIKQRRK